MTRTGLAGRAGASNQVTRSIGPQVAPSVAAALVRVPDQLVATAWPRASG